MTKHQYEQNGLHFEGFLATPDTKEPRPAVLIVHDWSGRNAFADEKAKKIAELGYVGFAVDLYGNGQVATTNEDKSALMHPLMTERALIRSRLQTALNEVRKLPSVDSKKIAIMGFCFGGLCALELARSGAEILGTVTFHGLLHADPQMKTAPIHAKILALHGYDDPMVPPEKVIAFAKEMTTAGADWQLHAYGNTLHAFTNPAAHDTKLGLIFDEAANRRSWIALENFLAEIFG